MKVISAKSISQLTPRQLEVLKVVANFTASHCYSPTIAELAGTLNISRSTVFEHLEELQKKSLLSVLPGKIRSLTLTSKSQELLESLADNEPEVTVESNDGIPLSGTVAAGVPIEAIETDERISLGSHFGADVGTFALKVAGDSMIEDGICSGDYVICKKASVANNGQLVVAIIDNENATLKRFYKENGRIRLQPANEKYEPIYPEICRIEAVVVGLMRKF